VNLGPRSPRFDEGISVDSSNEIVPNLWIGRLEIQPAEAFDAGFRVVIMLEEVTRNDVRPPPGDVFLSWPIEDSDERLPDEEMLDVVVDLAARSIRARRPTLITCMGGLNRSGLVAAMALCRLGHSPDEALALVRAARGPYALGNELFEQRLRREATTR
jgi:protein-tyrosine phosphatase